jgi:hypothetical protein
VVVAAPSTIPVATPTAASVELFVPVVVVVVVVVVLGRFGWGEGDGDNEEGGVTKGVAKGDGDGRGSILSVSLLGSFPSSASVINMSVWLVLLDSEILMGSEVPM